MRIKGVKVSSIVMWAHTPNYDALCESICIAMHTQNLVDKVKSWLTPSSWLSYLSPSKDDGSSRQLQKDDTSLPTPTHTHPLTYDHPLSSNTAAEDGPGPSDKPTGLRRSGPLPPASNLFNRDKSNRNSTANFRAALSLFEDALTENQESNNLSISNNSSNESFVEEDTEPEVIDTSRDTFDTSMQTGGQSTEGALSSSEDQLSSMARTHSPAPQVGGNETQEHDVQSVSNPTFSNKIKPSYRQTVKMSSRVTTGLSAELTRRLYSSMAVTTSTPELSPVREKQEEDVSYVVLCFLFPGYQRIAKYCVHLPLRSPAKFSPPKPFKLR